MTTATVVHKSDTSIVFMVVVTEIDNQTKYTTIDKYLRRSMNEITKSIEVFYMMIKDECFKSRMNLT